MMYKSALQHHKTFNNRIPITEWVLLNQNIIITSRQLMFKTSRRNRLKLGLNCISNRFWYLNDKINMDLLNLSFESFKVRMRTYSSDGMRTEYLANLSTCWQLQLSMNYMHFVLLYFILSSNWIPGKSR